MFHPKQYPFLVFNQPPAEPGGAPPAEPAPPTPAPPSDPTPAPTTGPFAPASGEPVKLPDDHPLVKAFNANKTELADAKKRLQDIDDANKTDLQKLQDENTSLKTELTGLRADKLRAEVAATKSDPSKGIYVPAHLLTGSTKEELEASADALIAFKGGATSPLPGNQTPAGPVAPVQEHEETREDRRKRLEAELKR